MFESRDLKMAGRLFALADQIYRNPRYYTARQLANLFSVSERTIRRDIHNLEDLGIRVESEEQGGYFILADLGKMPVALTSDERIAFKIIPHLLKGIEVDVHLTPVMQAYFSAINKVSESLGFSSNVTPQFNDLGDRILLESGSSSISISDISRTHSWTMELFYAMEKRLTTEIVYHSFNSNQTTTRLMDPYYLLPRNNSLYVIGYCHLRCEYRTFKMSRIKRVAVTNKRFILESDFSLDNFLHLAWGVYKLDEPIQVVLAFTSAVSRYIKEELNSSRVLRTWEDNRGRYIVEIMTSWNPEVQRWIQQFGSNVEILSPAALRDWMLEEHEKIVRCYRVEKSVQEG